MTFILATALVSTGLSPLAPDQWQFFLVSYAALFAVNNVLRRAWHRMTASRGAQAARRSVLTHLTLVQSALLYSFCSKIAFKCCAFTSDDRCACCKHGGVALISAPAPVPRFGGLVR